MAFVTPPPPVCATCERIARADGSETHCAGCGAPLPKRISASELALGPTHPGIVMPRICGTALLSIARITGLRSTVDQAEIAAHARADGLDLVVCARRIADGLPLPAHVGVNAAPDDGRPEDRAHDVWLDLEDGVARTLRFPPVPSGAEVVVRVRFADAYCERRITAR